MRVGVDRPRPSLVPEGREAVSVAAVFPPIEPDVCRVGRVRGQDDIFHEP